MEERKESTPVMPFSGLGRSLAKQATNFHPNLCSLEPSCLFETSSLILCDILIHDPLAEIPFYLCTGITETGARFSHGHWWVVGWVTWVTTQNLNLNSLHQQSVLTFQYTSHTMHDT